ncbi:30S ribosomal protein S3 [archaeon]|jgi:small subunit ribosomal protein S3|nr:30S ribosomal protein S3 [archaeon]MBT6697691.1 30S ribosomal protein S3 [archaeon]
MIEREFIKQKTKEFYIKSHIIATLKAAEVSKVTLKKIPLGEKIIVVANRPSIVVGSKGSNIRTLTSQLKSKFGLENPQVEIGEVENQDLDAAIVAQRIASSLERFGSARFKGIGHRTLSNVMAAGALGVEIKISGKIPGARAKNWRFYMGYLKKCGDVAINGVRTSYSSALLKSGVIGIQVRIMPGDLVLPDHVEILPEIVEEVGEEKEVKPEATKKPATKKKTTTKKAKAEKVVEVKSEESKSEEKVVAIEEKSPARSSESVEAVTPEVSEKVEESKEGDSS